MAQDKVVVEAITTDERFLSIPGRVSHAKLRRLVRNSCRSGVPPLVTRNSPRSDNVVLYRIIAQKNGEDLVANDVKAQ